MYQKEMIYMGLYKDESRLGSAGFLKVENRERESRLHLKIQNIPLGISGRFPIRVYDGNGWKEIDGITVQEGSGSWEEKLTKAADRVILKVMLPSGYYLEGKSKAASQENILGKSEEGRGIETVSVPIQSEEESPVSVPIQSREESPVSTPIQSREESLVSVPNQPREESPVSVPVQPREERPVSVSNQPRDAEEVRESGVVKESARETETVRKPAVREKILIKEELPYRAPEREAAVQQNERQTLQQNIQEYSLKEDKWEQILDAYENIHPYGDERVYVKLEPKDFVILQSKYQHLVNNSFLLHGFYNYRFVILGKEQDYYLGVPGVYYEREKMVALMFGFEAFECPGGNAKAGEFGYYLRKVEL